jgi:MoaA/NifB/PqqE/SkfB family radical SAM enzyme
MAGAIAGSAILELSESGRASELDTVTLTVNNLCNLVCPHCYLQYTGPGGVVQGGVLDAITRSQYRHLAIVGKEPLVNEESINTCTLIAKSNREHKRTTSLITNGVGLHRVPSALFSDLAWIDVSLDGGPRTYSTYRRGSLDHILAGVERARNLGLRSVRALHVLSVETLSALDDMLAADESGVFDMVVLSPYIKTRNAGRNSVAPVHPLKIIEALGRSKAFEERQSAVLLLDSTHLAQSGATVLEVESAALEWNIGRRIRIFPLDPIEYGFIRVTYDGLVLPPSDSLHPASYHENSAYIIGAEGTALPLQNIYSNLRPHFIQCSSAHAA